MSSRPCATCSSTPSSARPLAQSWDYLRTFCDVWGTSLSRTTRTCSHSSASSTPRGAPKRWPSACSTDPP
eukprot:356787-Pyramimonas_sp.AAC.1